MRDGRSSKGERPFSFARVLISRRLTMTQPEMPRPRVEDPAKGAGVNRVGIVTEAMRRSR